MPQSIAGNDDLFRGVAGVLPAADLADRKNLPASLSHALFILNSSKISSLELCKSLIKNVPPGHEKASAALLSVAAAADASGTKNFYHNPEHFMNVGAIWLNLARLQSSIDAEGSSGAFTIGDLLVGCCAAFGHDVGHDGGVNEDTPQGAFRLEKIAAAEVGSAMLENGVDARLAKRARCAILTTDVDIGYRILENALEDAPMVLDKSWPTELRDLLEPKTLLLASLLRDADVLQSAGLLPEDHDRQTKKIEAERGMNPGAPMFRGADIFFRTLLGGRFVSEAGCLFQHSLDELVRLNRVRLENPQCPGMGLAEIAQRGF